MSEKHVKITSPDGDEAHVHPSSVAAYERRGWTVEDDGSSEQPKKTAAKKTEKEG
jgi:hypothetical protein